MAPRWCFRGLGGVALEFWKFGGFWVDIAHLHGFKGEWGEDDAINNSPHRGIFALKQFPSLLGIKMLHFLASVVEVLLSNGYTVSSHQFSPGCSFSPCPFVILLCQRRFSLLYNVFYFHFEDQGGVNCRNTRTI